MRAVAAFLGRELHAAVLNRLILSFSAVASLAGLAPLFADVGGDPTATAAYMLLQATLYLIPLVSLLIATGSAQSEAEEQPILMSQPVRRGSRVIGKFLALWLVIAIAALLLVAPPRSRARRSARCCSSGCTRSARAEPSPRSAWPSASRRRIA